MQVVAVGISANRSARGVGVPFAAADAARLVTHSDSSSMAIQDDAATSERIAAVIHSLAQESASDPLVFVLLTSTRAEHGRLVADLADEDIDLGHLLQPLWQSRRETVVLALDLGRHAGRPPDGYYDAVLALRTDFPPGPGRIVLLSDDGRNASHASGELQAGIWAFHLASAVEGRDAQSREHDGRLTVRSLRDYLQDQVRSSLDRAFAEPRNQMPLSLAVDDTFVLAGRRLDQFESGVQDGFSFAGGTRLELSGELVMPVKQLGGFKASLHAVPRDSLDSTSRWIRQLAEPDLRTALDETAARLRQILGYRRRQIRASGPADGSASLLTPDFNLHFSVNHVANQPGLAFLRRTLTDLRDPEFLGRESLAQAFPKDFSSLFQPFRSRADIASIIDVLEEPSAYPGESIEYPTSLEYCEITLAGFSGLVRIDPAGLTITSNAPLSPPALARHYAACRQMLRGQ